MFSGIALATFGPRILTWARRDIEKVWRRAQAGLPCDASEWTAADRRSLAAKIRNLQPSPVRGLTDEEKLLRLEAAYHESGHVIAAEFFGWPNRGVSFNAGGGSAGMHYSIYGSQQSERHKLVVLKLAGPLAACKRFGVEYRYGGNPRNRSDERSIERLYGGPCADLYSFLAAREEAALLVNRAWPSIKKLAAEIYRHGELDEAEIRACLYN